MKGSICKIEKCIRTLKRPEDQSDLSSFRFLTNSILKLQDYYFRVIIQSDDEEQVGEMLKVWSQTSAARNEWGIMRNYSVGWDSVVVKWIFENLSKRYGSSEGVSEFAELVSVAEAHLHQSFSVRLGEVGVVFSADELKEKWLFTSEKWESSPHDKELPVHIDCFHSFDRSTRHWEFCWSFRCGFSSGELLGTDPNRGSWLDDH